MEEIKGIKTLEKEGYYEQCCFIQCNFNSADLSGVRFVNCRFEGCDFSLAKLKNSSLQEVKFVNCKLLGVQFSDCRKFMLELDFDSCILKLSLFSGLKLKNTRFRNCDMQETDFRAAFNYSINPETNRLGKAKFSIPGVTGLLDTYGIIIE